MVNYCSRVGARKNYDHILGDLLWPHLIRDVVLLSSCPAAFEYLRFEKRFSLIGDQVSDFNTGCTGCLWSKMKHIFHYTVGPKTGFLEDL